MPPAHSIAHYLHAANEFKPFAQQAQRLAELDSIFARILPPALLRSVRPAYWEAGVLLVTVSNGAIAAKLKQLVPNLLILLEKQGHKITGIRISVQVEQSTPPPPAKSAMSDANLAHWRELAQSLEPSPLKSAVVALLARRKTGS